jgi:hypothetical protein
MSRFTKPSQELLQMLGGMTLNLSRCGLLDFIILQVGQCLQHEARSRTINGAQHRMHVIEVKRYRTLRAFPLLTFYSGQFEQYLSTHLDHPVGVAGQNLGATQSRQ